MKIVKSFYCLLLFLFFFFIFPHFFKPVFADLSISEFSGNAVGENDSITAGADGNIWFTELSADLIGRMTPSGTLTEFPIGGATNWPISITSGPDGNI